MFNFNKLVNTLIESNTSTGLLGSGMYAYGDNRPFEPARAVIGAKITKNKTKSKKNQQMVTVPVQRRPKIENILTKHK